MDKKEKIIFIFNKQIKSELKKYKQLKECPSYWHKKAFLISEGLHINDWSEIQTEEYFNKKMNLNWDIQKIQFTIKSIMDYKENYY